MRGEDKYEKTEDCGRGKMNMLTLHFLGVCVLVSGGTERDSHVASEHVEVHCFS